MSAHLANNGADRAIGHLWEQNFCRLADGYGLALTPHQIGRPRAARWYRRRNPYLLPDVTVWSAPGEHHEIKHKDPTRSGCYGLEDYRLDALLAFADETKQLVLYTIHDWRHAGASDRDEPMENRIDDWFGVDVRFLATHPERQRDLYMPTWVGGQRTHVPGSYWPTSAWESLLALWLFGAPIASNGQHTLRDGSTR